MKKLYGVTTAMVTPFDENGHVDVDAVKAMVEFLIARGVNCLYPCGTTGEMFLMSEEDRKLMAETVVKQNAGRVTVFIHVGAMREDETVRLARHAYGIGADGIGIVTPAFFYTNPDAMVRYYETVMHSVPETFPCYLYNIPQCAANDLTVDVVKRVVASCKNAVGLKYSFVDMVRTDEYLDVGNGFEVMHGADRFMVPMLAMGCKGTVSGVSSVYPEPFAAVYRAFMAGDLEKAREMQKLATKFVVALKGGSNMAYFKSGLRFRGLNGGLMHAPQIELPADEEERLWKELAALEAGCPEELLQKI